VATLTVWLARLRALSSVVATALFVAIFLIFIYAVVMRYVMHQPVAWADELNIILFLWVMFLAGGLVLRDDEHVAFDITWQFARPEGRRTMGIVAALPGTWSYITFLWRERTSVLEWRLDWVYSCFLIFFVSIIVRFGASLVRLLGANWREHVRD